MRRSVIPLLFTLACASPHEDVVGPYTGEARRYVVDQIWLSTTNTQAKDYGGDLNGDGYIDNQLGQVVSMLASQGDVTSHGDDMIRAGVVTSSVIITADDLANDDSVSVRYLASDDDGTAVEVGGRFIDGAFEPNRTWRTKVPGAATLHLPVFVDADPSTIRLEGVEIELEADGDGYWAFVHGVVEDPMAAAFAGMKQMIDERPYDHPFLKKLLDGNNDGVVTFDELEGNSLFVSLLSPDVMYRGVMVTSFGFKAHLTPCAEGTCQPLQASCFDRVLDGDEVELDCGGGCRGCTEGATCNVAADCESLDCTDGACGPPSCSNGVRDGYETDRDCGGTCARKCEQGEQCLTGADCVTGQCGVPCEGPFCVGGWSYDTCR